MRMAVNVFDSQDISFSLNKENPCVENPLTINACTNASDPQNPCNNNAGTWISDLTKPECGFCKCPCLTCHWYWNGSDCIYRDPSPQNVQLYPFQNDCLCARWNGSGTPSTNRYYAACCQTNPDLSGCP